MRTGRAGGGNKSDDAVSDKDRQELFDFCRTLRGGYVNGIYRSAIERRKMAEATAATVGASLTKALNDLNLTIDERSRLPPYFRANVLNLLDGYKAPPPKSTKDPGLMGSAAKSSVGGSAVKQEPPTPFHLGFDDMAAAATGLIPGAPTSHVENPLVTQLRPSPVTSKNQRDSLEGLTFNPFSPETQKMPGAMAAVAASGAASSSGGGGQEASNADNTAATGASTPERVKSSIAAPGSAFSSFSPFISPNYMEAVMTQGMGMSITPAIVGSATPGNLLEAPPSWEAVDAKMLNDTFNSFAAEGETPSRRLDEFLEATEHTGPRLPPTEELARRQQTKLAEGDAAGVVTKDEANKDDAGGAPIISNTFSFSDVLSPEDDPMKLVPHATAVTDSGPLRMRQKVTNKDLSTHHFDAWESPTSATGAALTLASITRKGRVTRAGKTAVKTTDLPIESVQVMLKKD